MAQSSHLWPPAVCCHITSHVFISDGVLQSSNKYSKRCVIKQVFLLYNWIGHLKVVELLILLNARNKLKSFTTIFQTKPEYKEVTSHDNVRKFETHIQLVIMASHLAYDRCQKCGECGLNSLRHSSKRANFSCSPLVLMVNCVVKSQLCKCNEFRLAWILLPY